MINFLMIANNNTVLDCLHIFKYNIKNHQNAKILVFKITDCHYIVALAINFSFTKVFSKASKHIFLYKKTHVYKKILNGQITSKS